MNARGFKNLLITSGAFYLGFWLHLPLAHGYGLLTDRIVYTGEFAGTVVMPLVANLPLALVAALVGVTIVWQVESSGPMRWVVLAAALYVLSGFMGYHWPNPPGFLDRVMQAVGVLFPALACIVGGKMAAMRRAAAQTSGS